MKSKITVFLFLITALFLSCGKDDPIIDTPDNPDEPEETVITRIDGVIQKGPFLNGTAITVFELNKDFSPSGRSFASSINDNSGSYTLQNISLASEFIELRANGFYFNEILNRNSTAQLTLSAISDITNKSSLNINLLSTLEQDRVKLLINQGSDFASAKSQVQSEILSIFEIQAGGATESELRDISKAGDENAMLLAVSLILQGAFENVAELSKLVADIKSDVLNDGTLDDPTLGTLLVKNAQKLDKSKIRDNLQEKFVDLGLPGAVVPPFEKYIDGFLDNTPFVGGSGITYPEMGDNGENILFADFSETQTKVELSMTAILEEGTHLRLRVYHGGPTLSYTGNQQNTGWEHTENFWPDPIWEFESTRTGELDFDVLFLGPIGGNTIYNDVAVFEFFENYSTIPSFTKEIKLTDIVPKLYYPDYGDFGENILGEHFRNSMRSFDFSASMATELLRDTMSVRVKIKGEGWDYDHADIQGWEVSDLDPSDSSRVFTTDGKGSYDMKFDFYKVSPDSTGNFNPTQIELFENGETVPSEAFYITFF